MEFSKIEELLTCPVCQEISQSPIFQCTNGHITCSACIDELRDGLCPTCRVALPKIKIRALMVEQLSESIEVTCSNRSKGCLAKLKFMDYPQHLLSCSFEGFNWCESLGSSCPDSVTEREIFGHINSLHTTRTFSNSEAIQCTISQSIPKTCLQEGSCINWEPVFLIRKDTCFKKVFAITSNYDAKDKLFKWKCINLSELSELDGKDETSYLAHISMSASPEGVSNNKKVDCAAGLAWWGPVLPFSKSENNLKNNDSIWNSFCVPLNSVVSNLRNPNSNSKSDCYELELKFQIEKKGTAPPVFSASKPSTSVEFVKYHVKESDAATKEHIFFQVSCDMCDIKPIKGVRYKCSECEDYDLCNTCANTSMHDHHMLIRMMYPFMTFNLDEFQNSRDSLCGNILNEASELRVTQGTGNTIHGRVICDACGVQPIRGPRYRCGICGDFDLCAGCEQKGIHSFHWLIRTTSHNPQKLNAVKSYIIPKLMGSC